MKIFLDTANLDEIQQASDFGLLDGITTNPTLAAREGRPFRELILKACEIVKDGVVNAEVVSTDTDGMLREGRELASWHSNIVVKVPMTPAGVRALHVLHGEGIRINVIAPGLVLTPMTTRALASTEIMKYMIHKQPLRKGMLTTEDIARAACFLLRKDSSPITGQILTVDAGWAVSE